MSGKNKHPQLAKDAMEEEASSPIKSPDKKRAFKGGVDMDEDVSSPETGDVPKRQRMRATPASQRRAEKDRSQVDDEEDKGEQGEKGGKGKQPSTTPARGRGTKKSDGTGSGRSRSVPAKQRKSKDNRRSGSVDSSISSRRGKKTAAVKAMHPVQRGRPTPRRKLPRKRLSLRTM